jgi:LAO/AO transport system kinase
MIIYYENPLCCLWNGLFLFRLFLQPPIELKMWQTLHSELVKGDTKALARSISLVESEAEGFENFLASLPSFETKLIGITGPPGAGKSTLVDALIGEAIKENKKAAVLCVDPSSPFHLGALLGDRVRMSQWYTHPDVYIRSLASKGSMGGLHPRIIEITSVVAAANFDYIFIETVGVGQSEVEIAGLADVAVVVLVPEAGDDIQSMKAGLMEIAEIFVVNKSDRPGADTLVKNLQQVLANDQHIPVIKTIALQSIGIEELFREINQHKKIQNKHNLLLARRAFHLIQQKRMLDVTVEKLEKMIEQESKNHQFNLYSFIQNFNAKAGA